MAKITVEDLKELEGLIKALESSLRDSERVAAGLSVRHPLFRDRTIDVPVTGDDQTQIDDRKNQAETALANKMKTLTT